MKVKLLILGLLILGITAFTSQSAHAELSLTKFLQKKYTQCLETYDSFSRITTRDYCSCAQNELRNNIDTLDLKLINSTPGDPRFYNKLQLSLGACYHHFVEEKILNTCLKSIEGEQNSELRKQCHCIATKTARNVKQDLPKVYSEKIRTNPFKQIPLSYDDALNTSQSVIKQVYTQCVSN